MRAIEAEAGPPVVTSESERLDVPALFARLKEELRHAPGLDVSEDVDRGIVRQRLRSVAETTWAVTAERPFERRPGLLGAARHAVKKVLRRLMRWYVEPFAVGQRSFNSVALKLVDELFEEVDLLFTRLVRAEGELDAARERERLLHEVDERLTRLERRRSGDTSVASQTVASQPAQTAFPDYFAFESRMRGATSDVSGRQDVYVDDFRDSAPVLDVGCGRGELLALLRAAGIEARGVDADPDMVAYARGAGLDVEQADLLDHLEGLPDCVARRRSSPARSSSTSRRRRSSACSSWRTSSSVPGGVLILETINPLSPLALRNYFADLTHAQPLVPATLELLARQAGFRETETRFLNSPPDTERLRQVELPDGPEFDQSACGARLERRPAERPPLRTTRLRTPGARLMGILRRAAIATGPRRRGARALAREPGQLRLDYFSPLPPERSGISEYSSLLLPALQRRFDVEVAARGRAAVGDVCLYHVGNNPDAHAWIVEALRRRPGVVVLHDFVLHHLVAGMTLGRGDAEGYLGAMQRDAGVEGRLLAHGVIDGVIAPLWEVRPEDFPLAGEILEHAAKPGGGLIVHSQYVERNVRAMGYEGRLWRIPHPAWRRPATAPASIEGGPIIGCFGHLTASKRIPQLIQAFQVLRRLHPEARLLVVGAATPGFSLEARLRESDLVGVVREDYVDEERLWALMSACDVVVSLRTPTMGETSGSAIRALVTARPLVVSDVGWFSELPDEVALKIPVDSLEIATLTTALELLASSERARAEMSASARAYVRSEHALDRVAHAYAAALEEVAVGETVRAPAVARSRVPLGV